MKNVRLGIIGMGGIGRHHADYILAGQISRCELTAVCSSSPSKLEKYKPLRIFGDGLELIGSGMVDAVIIATPHYQHMPLGIAALEQGVHVMVEKPIAAHKADAERLIAAHARNRAVTFAAMFQLRAEHRYRQIRELVQSGELGTIVRVNWIVTDWYRTDAYFAGGSWRANWKGEGGGVLLNQTLHNLDMLSWLLGQPSKVRGFCQFGRFHKIEVEDDVTAYLEWEKGVTGTLVTSTGESPGTNRLEIAGTRGRLVSENSLLAIVRNEADMVEFSRIAALPLARPGTRCQDISCPPETNLHARLMDNFVKAILDGEPLVAPGEEGINSLELANALVYSTFIDRAVGLPLDGSAWERKLNELIAASQAQG